MATGIHRTGAATLTSIYAIRTVCTPRVMPPKMPHTPQRPAMSLEQDAAAIRKRFRRSQNYQTGHTQAREANAAQMAEAKARIARENQAIADLLAFGGPYTIDHIAKAIGIPRDRASDILRAMEAKSTARYSRGERNRKMWGLV
jgi:hypothetical protein